MQTAHQAGSVTRLDSPSSLFKGKQQVPKEVGRGKETPKVFNPPADVSPSPTTEDISSRVNAMLRLDILELKRGKDIMQFNLEEQIKELRTHNNRLLQQLESKDKHISTLQLQVSKLKCQMKEMVDGGQMQGMEEKTWSDLVDYL